MEPPIIQTFAVNALWSVAYFARHVKIISVQPVSSKKISTLARNADALNATAVMEKRF